MKTADDIKLEIREEILKAFDDEWNELMKKVDDGLLYFNSDWDIKNFGPIFKKSLVKMVQEEESDKNTNIGEN